ncbi:hypothetical protein BGI41_06405 [Methanobrevibacter sp. 87.7]|uniref:DUF366 family protein n=1 Tax=Methanobrevibacter sp. 87.7 TaxID=387957 RepID=UPI000B5044E8|nr:DUF366 family protein [Methanobrevibacter sp. 87.7]OWT32677.1 hypothetical protein BGI41_06405 [Methanobrevibacter sp. 87.7]
MSIIHKHIQEKFPYDGSQIEPMWAFREFNVRGSSIISWRGPMNIHPENIKDFADVGTEIKSNEMFHTMTEFFDCQPANMRIAYLRQRLLILIFNEHLVKRGIISNRDGDDIYINGRKLSVCIATASISSMKIHFALNIKDEGTPDDVETIGLFDIKDSEGNQIFNDDNICDFMNEVLDAYINELNTLDLDISKTKIL